jgi:hypothetical protein
MNAISRRVRSARAMPFDGLLTKFTDHASMLVHGGAKGVMEY